LYDITFILFLSQELLLLRAIYLLINGIDTNKKMIFIQKYFLFKKYQNTIKIKHKLIITGKNNPKNEIGQNRLGLINGEINEEIRLKIIKEFKKKIVK
tara:strand:- start:560 stop:853 length:294 start_codon:yes stop_codon:yes gene_type:complete